MVFGISWGFQYFLNTRVISNVGIAIINHPPFITISMGGIKPSKMGGLLLLYPHDSKCFCCSWNDVSLDLIAGDESVAHRSLDLSH